MQFDKYYSAILRGGKVTEPHVEDARRDYQALLRQTMTAGLF